MGDKELNEIVDAETQAYLERANKVALENMIALCLHVTPIPDMVAFLRHWADHLESEVAPK